jgi:hypothetical protein
LPALLLVAVVTPLGLATPAAAHYSCGASGPGDRDGSASGRSYDGVNMPVGSSTNCAIRAVSNDEHALDYHCFTTGDDGYTWTYLWNAKVEKFGWIRDDKLKDYGSRVLCPN